MINRQSRLLGIASAIGALFITTVYTAPATAFEVHEVVQSASVKAEPALIVSAAAQFPEISRDDWGVTEYDIISMPVANWAISDCFGCRNGTHRGVDFTPGDGTPITAIAEGTVVAAGYDGGYGNRVIISHIISGQSVESLYAHMQDNSIAVSQGDHVSADQLLGLTGSTGNSTGPHLHLEITVSGILVDPYAWLQGNINEDWLLG